MNIQECADTVLMAIGKIDDSLQAEVSNGMRVWDYFDGDEDDAAVEKYAKLYKVLYNMDLTPQELVQITVYLANPTMVNRADDMLKALGE